VDARTIAVSEGVERAFTGDSGRYKPGQHQQWCTIYNGIDTESIYNKVVHSDPQTVRKKWQVDADLIYLNISRYVEAKAQTDLIAAMADVVNTEPDSHLFLVGWGPLENRLKAAVEKNDLEEQVTVTGKVPTVHEYYALADVFVSSSVFEGMPIAHLEAMAAGLPLVATDIPGVNEVVVPDENGFLVSPEQPTHLGEAMLALQNKDLRTRFGEASRHRAQKEFSIDETVETHLALYRELLER
jgi:glycosyltransferase involved in cell wall biosynthesis